MSEERKLILNMLKEGKITDDEALKLLDAIKDNKKPSDTYSKVFEQAGLDESNFDKAGEKIEEKAKSFVSKILTGVEYALNKAGDALNNVEFDFSNFTIHTYEAKAERKLQITDINSSFNLFVENKNGNVQISSWDEESILCNGYISYDQKELFGDEEFIIINQLDNNYQITLNDEINTSLFNAKLEIFIPEDLLNNLEIITSNGKIIANSFEAKEIELKTTNGKIEADDIISTSLIAQTINSKIVLTDISTNEITAKTTNGKIELVDIATTNISAKNTNGSIYISSPSNDVRYINLQSTNGGLYIEDIDLNRPVKATLLGRSYEEMSPKFTRADLNGKVRTIYTENFDPNSTDFLELELTTTNGKVAIIE